MNEPIHTISLGGGVQSCTVERLARLGLIKPLPSAAIFADTHWEPKHVYRQLDELEAENPPFSVLRVSKGSLKEEILKRRERDFQTICADGGAREIPFLHSSLIPLDQIDFAALVAARSHTNQISLFDNECVGICGV